MTGYLLLVLVYCIPEKAMDSKMRTSAVVLQQEGVYPQLPNHANSALDNYTDALMLLTAYQLLFESAVCEFGGDFWRGEGADGLVEISACQPYRHIL